MRSLLSCAIVFACAALAVAKPTPTTNDNGLEARRLMFKARSKDRAEDVYSARIGQAQVDPALVRRWGSGSWGGSPPPASPSGSCTDPNKWNSCGDQCGGDGWGGSQCCRPGQSCKQQSSGKYICSYDDCNDACPGTAYTSSDQRFKQCGGQGWTGRTCCPTDFASYCISSFYCYCAPNDKSQDYSGAWNNGWLG